MISIDVLTTFFGWCTVINIGLLLYTFIFISVFQKFTIKIHSKLMNVEPAELPKIYFNYIALYKIIIIVFNIVPYFSLKLMS